MAQQKSDFSGEWRLGPQASVLSPVVAPVVQSGVLLIMHREPSFAADLTTVLGGQPFRARFELQSDGPNLRWDGDTLVATFRHQGPDGEVTISFRV